MIIKIKISETKKEAKLMHMTNKVHIMIYTELEETAKVSMRVAYIHKNIEKYILHWSLVSERVLTVAQNLNIRICSKQG